MSENLLERAVQIAVAAHSGQRDKAGAPYILHPLRVMLRQTSEPAMIVAVLHDVVEDSGWDFERLRAEGFSQDVLDALDSVTKRDGEPYEVFVQRAMAHPIGRQVKLADLEDNMDVRRLDKLGPAELERLSRYLAAWHAVRHDP